MTESIAQVALAVHLPQYFDYQLPADANQARAGCRVRVPFRRGEQIGIVINLTSKTDVPAAKLRTILEVLDTEPVLDEPTLALCQWASRYYHHPIGEVIASALPAAIRKGKPAQAKPLASQQSIETQAVTLSPEQQQAVDSVSQHFGSYQAFLLEGVTGSGKTEVYFELIQQQAKQKKQSLVLVPEIGLTPQTVARLEQRLNLPLVQIHSGLTEKQRLTAWQQAREQQALVVIGTRSALFTPLPNLGLIIVDEEHDLSFKQQDGFRYSARDLALVRAQMAQVPIVLGTATPSLKLLHLCQQQRCQTLQLSQRALASTPPTVELVDLKPFANAQNPLSPPLVNAINKAIASDQQVLLFINRRGFAPMMLCPHCGWHAHCPHCDIPQTFHRSDNRLHCHHCGHRQALQKFCPDCQQATLAPQGFGTQRIESLLQEQFPDVEVIRVDRDSTRSRKAFDALFAKIKTGKRQILLGTQMLAKGHDLENLALVGVLNADAGLFSHDFRAAERLAQLITQVIGRAGRRTTLGHVIIQTHHPEHALFQSILHHGYRYYAEQLLKERQAATLPPYQHMALVRAESKQQQSALQFLDNLKNHLQHNHVDTVQLLGPVTAIMEKRAQFYRAQLLLKSAQRDQLHHQIAQLKSFISTQSNKQVRWSIDVDPQEVD